MRPVRVVDVLFALNSAAGLLGRVAASQVNSASRVYARRENAVENLVEEKNENSNAELDDKVVQRTLKVDERENVSEAVEPQFRTRPLQPRQAERNLKFNDHIVVPDANVMTSTTSVVREESTSNGKSTGPHQDIRKKHAKQSFQTMKDFDFSALPDEVKTTVALKASKVPGTRIGRLFHYGGLAAGLGMGVAGEFLRRTTTSRDSSQPQGSLIMSEANVSRLVDKLSRMRGAALKLGQFLSIQDSHVLPEQIEQIFRRVQNSAHYMPNWQMEQVMTRELGSDWRSKFSEFNPIPIAAASIGQVHSGILAGNGMPVAIKIQFPSVAESIHSDLDNLSMLLAASAVLPKGLFLDNTLKTMKAELADECDYVREAECARRFGRELEGDERFEVMKVVDELSTAKVLTMERMDGVPIVQAEKWPQELRNYIATSVLSLCLRELFHFRFMQTDPNWSNFLFNKKTGKIQLIDFGASREYSKEFIDDWLRLLQAGINGDKDRCIHYSLKLGYLTGQENQTMLDAHAQSIILLGSPFRSNTPQPYAFAEQNVSEEIRELIPVMLRNRLTPPPRETYSLNRKLSGAFLLCGKLRARVDCAQVWDDVTSGYSFSSPE